MKVYVVTNPESGWDCVCAVCLTLESLRSYFEERIDFEEGELDHKSVRDIEAILDTLNKPYIIHEEYAG
jgi:hypothetical protein